MLQMAQSSFCMVRSAIQNACHFENARLSTVAYLISLEGQQAQMLTRRDKSTSRDVSQTPTKTT